MVKNRLKLYSVLSHNFFYLRTAAVCLKIVVSPSDLRYSGRYEVLICITNCRLLFCIRELKNTCLLVSFHQLTAFFTFTNNNNNDSVDNVYGAVITTKSLQDFSAICCQLSDDSNQLEL